MLVTAIVVTRGDRDISPVISSLSSMDEVIVWNNATAPKDVKVYGRFAAAALARNNLIYIQDDDCFTPWPKIKRSFLELNKPCVCNFPEDRRKEYAGTGIALMGWGTLFHKDLLRVFDKYTAKFPIDDLFYRECDRIFSFLTRTVTTYVDHGVYQLDYAYGSDRMGTEARHRDDLKEIQRKIKSL